MNTYLVLAWLAVTAWWGSAMPGPQISGRALLVKRLAIGAGLLLLISVFGAWNALADTLFPAESISEGVAAELADTAPFLLRIRVLHPLIAVVAGFGAAWVAFSVGDKTRGATRRLGFFVVGLVFVQFFVGVANIFLLTPIETQVVHLLVADALWIAYVMFFAAAVGEHADVDLAMERAA